MAYESISFLPGLMILIFMVLLFLALYVYISLAFMTIARKTKTKNAWFAWIPIANFYLFTQIARVSGLWTLVLLAYVVPILGGLAIMVTSVWLFWRICKRRKFPGEYGLLMIIPIVNFVILGIVAWSERK